jgi:2-dehydro-3-deoxygluconokinase
MMSEREPKNMEYDLLGLVGRVGLVSLVGVVGQVVRPRRRSRAAADLGPREVIVRGPTTVGALESGSWTEMEIQCGAAIDPIGAGDAFNAGYIAARLRAAASTRRCEPASTAGRR